MKAAISNPQRGQKRYVTAPALRLTGYMLTQYTEACISAAKRIRRGYGTDLPKFFQAFVSPTIRSSVPVVEMQEILGLSRLVNGEDRLADIVRRARELSWELVVVLRPGEGISANRYLLMPAQHRSGEIVIERIMAENGVRVEELVLAQYGDELRMLEDKLLNGAADFGYE